MPDNKWSQPASPPPPMFLGKKERDYTKQVNDEVIERVVGQQIVYYPISYDKTNFHPLYGEAIEKTFLPPIRVYALINWEGDGTVTPNYGLDKESKIIINFHRRRLTEDQDLFVREGDFVCYGDRFYEIVKLNEPRELFGQANHRFEITATCIQARKGLFRRVEPGALTRIRRLVQPQIQRVLVPTAPDIIIKSNEVLVFCPTPGSADVDILQDYADTPGDHFGKVIYVAKVSGSIVVPPFVQEGKFYFNEVGTWHPSPFILCPPDPGAFDDCD
jgi:hypothetical protein